MVDALSLAVLLHLLAGEHQAARGLLKAGAPPPATFLRFVQRHYLVWLLVDLVDRAGLRSSFVADDLTRLERATEARLGKVGRLVDQLIWLWPRVRERGIDCLLLKGPYLSERFYGEGQRRGFFDIDLLIRPEQLTETERLLDELGYNGRSTILLSRRLTTRFTHGLDYAKDGLGLDLHWSLGAHASYRIDYERVWSTEAVYRLGGEEIRVLSDEDTFFLHLLGLFEDLDRGAARYRSFVDVHAMLTALDSRIDWPMFWERRRAERTDSVCRAVLGLFFVLFDATTRFPLAADSVAPAIQRLATRPLDESLALVESREGALRNKVWAMRLYESPVLVNVAWWLRSLPFRLAVYNAGKPPRMSS